MSDRITAPWTDDQIAALNSFQRAGVMHPFTCGNDGHRMRPTLVAELDGWRCPDESCDYRQTWAHGFMADPTALAALPQLIPTAPVVVGVGHLVQQPDGSERPGGFTYLPNPALTELSRVREQLRATEFDLGQERQQNVVLLERLTAEEKKVEALRIELRMIEAARRIPAQPPDPDGGLCEPVLYERPVRDVATGGVL